MTDRIRLHYAPDNASLVIRLALEELGIPYDTILVDRSTKAQDSAGYRAINPNGLIPAIETAHGAIFETAAILLWLDEMRPGTLAPPPGAPLRGDFLKWLVFLSNTLHAALRINFYTEKYIDPLPGHVEALRNGATRDLSRHLSTLDAAAGNGVFGGEAITMIDIYLCCMLRWMAIYPTGKTEWFDLEAWPSLRAAAIRMDQRDSTAKAIIAEGLGAAPFSNPVLPDPPEGSATGGVLDR